MLSTSKIKLYRQFQFRQLQFLLTGLVLELDRVFHEKSRLFKFISSRKSKKKKKIV